jgi:hypothetical protein
VIICGKGKSGKSTICGHLYKNQNVLVCNDDLIKLFFQDKNNLKIVLQPTDIEIRDKVKTNNKEKIENEYVNKIFDMINHTSNLIFNLDCICLLSGKIKGDTMIKLSNYGMLKEEIEKTQESISGKVRLKNLNKNFPVLEIKLGLQLKNFHEKLADSLDMISQNENKNKKP